MALDWAQSETPTAVPWEQAMASLVRQTALRWEQASAAEKAAGMVKERVP